MNTKYLIRLKLFSNTFRLYWGIFWLWQFNNSNKIALLLLLFFFYKNCPYFWIWPPHLLGKTHL